MRILLRSAAFLPLALALVAHAQPQKPAEEKLQFDVTSIRPSQPNTKSSSNVPMGRGNVFPATGGILRAKGFTALYYLTLAYRLTDYQVSAIEAKAPGWIAQDNFDIEARTDDLHVTKDEMRLMMRSLLADRFALAAHYETRPASVYALVVDKSGTTGPKLQAHPPDAVCPNYSTAKRTPEGDPVPKQPEAIPGGFPTICGGILGLHASAQDRYSFGARDIPMGSIATVLSSWGNLGRPVVDQTGLSGNYDFVLDFTPDPRPSYATIDSGGPSFQEALKKQLGLRLESQKGPVEFLVLDHIERPTPN